jgi:hypothetical protein
MPGFKNRRKEKSYQFFQKLQAQSASVTRRLALCVQIQNNAGAFENLV